MQVTAYQEKYKQDFIALNTQWVERFFKMEQSDRDILEHVDELLAKGSMIYVAVEDEQVLAVCMVMPLENDNWEICKLAARAQYTGSGAGSAVFQACMDYAKAHKAKRIILISNRKLKPALHIYEKFGFKEIPLDHELEEYERADIQFEYVC